MCASANIRQLLAAAEQQLRGASSSPRLDAQVLASEVFGLPRAMLLAHLDDRPSVAEMESFASLVSRRATGEPLPYILEKHEFYGLAFRVTSETLIPRPETELLVERFVAEEPSLPTGPIADLGTGCGCVLISALTHSGRSGIGTDIEKRTLAVAHENLSAHGLTDRAGLVLADLLTPIRPSCLAALLANLPYVAVGDPRLEPQVAAWEPARALYAGADGLSLIRRLIPQAASALRTGGGLFLEIGIGQADDVRAMLKGWREIAIYNDLGGVPRVVSARK